MDHALLPTLAAFVGIDWATTHHDLALQVADGTTSEQSRIAHTPEAITQWLSTMQTRFGGQAIGIAMETSRGPLVHALLEAPFVMLYPINPRSLQRFREAFAPSGAKDDAPDAQLLLSLLVKHRDQLACWRPEDVDTRTLSRLVEYRRSAIALRTQLTLQLQAALKEYFPQAQEWAGEDLTSPLACEFLRRWPTLAALQRARPSTVNRFYTMHHCRRGALIAKRLAEIATAVPLTRDPAVIDSTTRFVALLAQQLGTLRPSIAQLDADIAQRFAAHADAAIFRSVPGAGAAFAPRLLSAFGTDRSRFPSAVDMQQRAGIAPITIRSGRHEQVCWRWSASNFLRQTFHEFAGHSVRHSTWAKAFYRQQRVRGKSHHAAIRALAYKWIRILWRCWQDGTAYDEARYTRALARRGSPLTRLLPNPSIEATA